MALEFIVDFISISATHSNTHTQTSKQAFIIITPFSAKICQPSLDFNCLQQWFSLSMCHKQYQSNISTNLLAHGKCCSWDLILGRSYIARSLFPVNIFGEQLVKFSFNQFSLINPLIDLTGLNFAIQKFLKLFFRVIAHF